MSREAASPRVAADKESAGEKSTAEKKPSKAKKSSKAATDSFSVGDRVKRKDFDGPLGTVHNVRTETVVASLKDSKEKPIETITVNWDNGTVSHLVPAGLSRS